VAAQFVEEVGANAGEKMVAISSPRQKTIFDVAGLMLNDGELFRWSAERIGR